MTVSRRRLHEIVNHLESELLMGHFTPPESKRDFDLHFLAQKIDRMAELDAEIMRVDGRAELDFFHFIRVVMLLGFLFLLGLLIAELPEIHQTADRGSGVRRDFHKVHAFGAGQVNRISERNDSQLGAIDANDADFAGTDFPVDPDK